METDGKGESQPADKNTSAAGKANNRRVEFIKK
jgi:outer membrane protein OmpA-like peptidoglycan-associated protein